MSSLQRPTGAIDQHFAEVHNRIKRGEHVSLDLDEGSARFDTSPVPVASVKEAVTDTEQQLAEVLAGVMKREQVGVTSNFFDDLGADSLVMAHFCAKLRKHENLPSVSIKEVYEHQTIRELAEATATADRAAEHLVESPSAQPESSLALPTPVGKWQYILCGITQFVTMLGYSFVLGFAIAQGFDWVVDGVGNRSLYARSVVFGAAFFFGLSVVPIAAKWLLIGRWKPGQIRIWSLRYLRFWFVKFLLGQNPLGLFRGSPLYAYYFRALGAKVGKGTVILGGGVPVCADLLTIGDNAIIRKDSILSGYRAHAGLIEMGPVTIGCDAFVGEMTMVDINTSIGDGGQLGHSSSLHAGDSIPAGERWVGTPARQRIEFDYRAIPPKDRSTLRRTGYSIVQLVLLFVVSLPLFAIIPMIVAELPLTPAALRDSQLPVFSTWSFYGQAAVLSLALFFAVTLFRLALALTLPRLLNRAIKQDLVYPLYGVRFWIHRAIGRLTNLKFFANLFGDTSWIVHYLYALGYDVSFSEQTGANFGLNVKHDNPYNIKVGPGTMAADGLSIINTDYSSSSFRVAPVTIGSHSFLGNNVGFHSHSKTGENCLLATKVMVPLEGSVRGNTGFLGSPSFEIPRMVLRDRKFDDLKVGDEHRRRLKAKNRHNAATMALFLLTRWLPTFALLVLGWSSVVLYQRIGAIFTVFPLMLLLLFGSLYYILVERASTLFRPLRPLYCSMYDKDSWRVERYWKLGWQPAFLNGTPFKSLAWRLLGVRIGSRVFDDGCLMIDKTMITIGDDCVLNAGSVIQPHSQEDGSFKSDYINIGDGCTLGIGALVHYGVSMGDGATLAANAFLMKGAEVPPATNWGENPARELGNDRKKSTPKPASVPLPVGRVIVPKTGGQIQ